MTSRKCLAAAVAVLISSSISAGAATFTAPPTATKAADGAKINFAVSEAVDVDVAIVDAAGAVVRHIGGGMLGDNPPAPFAKGLRQELTWDGKDDLGNAAQPPFKVRVRLGMTPRFDRILGWSGQEIENIRGLTCGPDGTLYLIYGGSLWGHRQSTVISAFDRDGNYLRQVLPGPGGLPPEKRNGWPHVIDDAGREIPFVWHPDTHAVNPSAIFADRNFPTAAPDGRLVMLSNSDSGMAGVTSLDFHGGRRLLRISPDGSVPGDYLGPTVAGETEEGFGFVAISPDGKFAYVSGLGGGAEKRNPKPIRHVVYRVPLDGSGPAEVFAGKLNTAAAGAEGFDRPMGLAVDKDGNLYIADFGNNRIAVRKPDGAFLKELPVNQPYQVLVSRKSGAIYVVADDGGRIVKFTGPNDPAEKAAFVLPPKAHAKEQLTTMAALDDSGAKPTLWIVTRNWISSQLRRVIDDGDKFTDAGLVGQNSTGMNFSGSFAVVGNRLFTRARDLRINRGKPLIFNVQTGQLEGEMTTTLLGSGNSFEFRAGKDGLLYSQSNGWPKNGLLCRLDPKTMKIKPFGESEAIATYHGHTRTSGYFVDRHGNIYVPGGDSYRALNPGAVRVYGPDGKQKGEPVLNMAAAYYGGIAVDSRGNIYLGAAVAEKNHLLPTWTDGRLPKPTPAGYPTKSYRQIGSIIKFKPTGGAIEADPAGQYVGAAAYKRAPVSLKNAEWLRRGGEVPARAGGPDGVHCFCETSRFDIDGYDRLFVPDTFRFGVQVLDSAGNQITLIGSFGNMDNRGPDSAQPKPEIAYAWPLATQVDGDRLYVLDLNNRRIAVARLDYAASQMCEVK